MHESAPRMKWLLPNEVVVPECVFPDACIMWFRNVLIAASKTKDTLKRVVVTSSVAGKHGGGIVVA